MTDSRPHINAIELTRTGEGGGWRIAIPMSTIHTLPTGRELAEPAATIAHNAAELLHDEEFAQCMALVDKVANRIASGELAPLPPAAEESSDVAP